MIITLAEYKEYEGFKTPNADDKLQILVDYVNEFIERFCSTKFGEEVEVLGERQYITDGIIILKNAPLIDVIEATHSDNLVSVSYTEPDEGILHFDDKFLEGKMVKVSYLYGYETAPAGLKVPAFELVTYFNKREFNKSQTIGATGESVSFSDPNSIPTHIRSALELYRVL